MAPTYFVIIGSRFSAVDVVTPIINELRLARPTARIYFVFVEDTTYKHLARDPFLSEEVMRLANGIFRLKWGEGRIGPLFRMARLFVRMLTSPGLIVLHARGGSRFIHAVATVTRVMGGKCLEHPKSFVPVIFHKLDGSRTIRKDEGDGFICFSKLDLPYYKSQGHTKLHVVGYPRFYSSWLTRARTIAPILVESECGVKPEHEVVALFLGSTVKGIYEFSELKDWLADVARVLSNALPAAAVLVKPHPMECREPLQPALANVDRNLILTDLHVSVLSARARFVIAYHTSTILDALAAGKPVIQYQNFTSHWMTRHPEKSIFPKVGSILAQTHHELEDAVSRVIAGDERVQDVRHILGHVRDLNILRVE